MIYALSAAGVNIADIVVSAIIALGVLAGIIAGFARMLKGGFGTIVALIIAVVLGATLASKLSEVSFMQTLFDKVNAGIGGWADNTTHLAVLKDGVIKLETQPGQFTPLLDIYANGLSFKVAKLAQPIIIALCAKSLNGTLSLSEVISGLVTDTVSGLIIFIVATIVILILFNVLSAILYKIMSSQKNLKVIDRIIGLVFSAAISVVIVFAIMFVVSKIGPATGEFNTMIETSSVAKWFFENNPFTIFLS